MVVLYIKENKMILVTLGTQDKPFERLLKAIEEAIENKWIQDEIIVQAGCTKFKSQHMKIVDLLPTSEFEKLLEQCDIVITHGGVGTILKALSLQKKIIAIPRQAKYQEHHNDHQITMIEEFARLGYLLPLIEMSELKQTLQAIENFKPAYYQGNNQKMLNIIRTFLNN